MIIRFSSNRTDQDTEHLSLRQNLRALWLCKRNGKRNRKITFSRRRIRALKKRRRFDTDYIFTDSSCPRFFSPEKCSYCARVQTVNRTPLFGKQKTPKRNGENSRITNVHNNVIHYIICRCHRKMLYS